jgi:hypothetical protein
MTWEVTAGNLVAATTVLLGLGLHLVYIVRWFGRIEAQLARITTALHIHGLM